jgi:hypothetical protein
MRAEVDREAADLDGGEVAGDARNHRAVLAEANLRVTLQKAPADHELDLLARRYVRELAAVELASRRDKEGGQEARTTSSRHGRRTRLSESGRCSRPSAGACQRTSGAGACTRLQG